MIVVLMGVSGCGKTEVGRALSSRTGWEFIDADDHHPPANVAKMSAGTPLTDEDRRPWLGALNQLILDHAIEEKPLILACSALKGDYRDQLSANVETPIRWVLLDADEQTIRQRLTGRTHHFMPASLLQSQLATLERPTDAWIVDASPPVAAIVKELVARLGA